jgi:hypothetical protein
MIASCINLASDTVVYHVEFELVILIPSQSTINLRADLHVLHLSAVGAPCSAVPE